MAFFFLGGISWSTLTRTTLQSLSSPPTPGLSQNEPREAQTHKWAAAGGHNSTRRPPERENGAGEEKNAKFRPHPLGPITLACFLLFPSLFLEPRLVRSLWSVWPKRVVAKVGELVRRCRSRPKSVAPWGSAEVQGVQRAVQGRFGEREREGGVQCSGFNTF